MEVLLTGYQTQGWGREDDPSAAPHLQGPEGRGLGPLIKGSGSTKQATSPRTSGHEAQGRPPRPSRSGTGLTHFLGCDPRPATALAPLRQTPATGRRGLHPSTPREKGLLPRSKMASSGLPSFLREPPLGPHKGERERERDVAAPTQGSGKLHEPAATPRPPGGDFISSGTGSWGWGRPKGRAAGPQPAQGGRQIVRPPPPPRKLLFSSSGPPDTLGAAEGAEVPPHLACSTPSAPEVLCGGCSRAGRRRVDLS